MEWLKKRAWPPYNRRRVSRSELGCDGLAGPGKAPAAAALLALAGREAHHARPADWGRTTVSAVEPLLASA